MIAMNKHEEELAEFYGFIVSEQGDRYVVTDPKLGKKKKFIGGNLYSLMLEAVNERKRLNIKPPVKESIPNDNVVNFEKKSSTPKTTAVPPAAANLAPASSPVPTKGNKLYLIKKILLESPKATVSEITQVLQASGYTASTSTISTARSDFLHSVRVIKEMNRWRDC